MTARFHGPSSPLGAVIAMVVLASPLVLGITSALWWSIAVAGPVVVGLAMLPVAGRPRHLGTGLLVGALTYPLVIAMILLVSAAASLAD